MPPPSADQSTSLDATFARHRGFGAAVQGRSQGWQRGSSLQSTLGAGSGLSDSIARRWDNPQAGGTGQAPFLSRLLSRGQWAQSERRYNDFSLSRPAMPMVSWLGAAPEQPEASEPAPLPPLSRSSTVRPALPSTRPQLTSPTPAQAPRPSWPNTSAAMSAPVNSPTVQRAVAPAPPPVIQRKSSISSRPIIVLPKAAISRGKEAIEDSGEVETWASTSPEFFDSPEVAEWSAPAATPLFSFDLPPWRSGAVERAWQGSTGKPTVQRKVASVSSQPQPTIGSAGAVAQSRTAFAPSRAESEPVRRSAFTSGFSQQLATQHTVFSATLPALAPFETGKQPQVEEPFSTSPAISQRSSLPRYANVSRSFDLLTRRVANVQHATDQSTLSPLQRRSVAPQGRHAVASEPRETSDRVETSATPTASSQPASTPIAQPVHEISLRELPRPREMRVASSPAIQPTARDVQRSQVAAPLSQTHSVSSPRSHGNQTGVETMPLPPLVSHWMARSELLPGPRSTLSSLPLSVNKPSVLQLARSASLATQLPARVQRKLSDTFLASAARTEMPIARHESSPPMAQVSAMRKLDSRAEPPFAARQATTFAWPILTPSVAAESDVAGPISFRSPATIPVRSSNSDNAVASASRLTDNSSRPVQRKIEPSSDKTTASIAHPESVATPDVVTQSTSRLQQPRFWAQRLSESRLVRPAPWLPGAVAMMGISAPLVAAMHSPVQAKRPDVLPTLPIRRNVQQPLAITQLQRSPVATEPNATIFPSQTGFVQPQQSASTYSLARPSLQEIRVDKHSIAPAAGIENVLQRSSFVHPIANVGAGNVLRSAPNVIQTAQSVTAKFFEAAPQNTSREVHVAQSLMRGVDRQTTNASRDVAASPQALVPAITASRAFTSRPAMQLSRAGGENRIVEGQRKTSAEQSQSTLPGVSEPSSFAPPGRAEPSPSTLSLAVALRGGTSPTIAQTSRLSPSIPQLSVSRAFARALDGVVNFPVAQRRTTPNVAHELSQTHQHTSLSNTSFELPKTFDTAAAIARPQSALSFVPIVQRTLALPMISSSPSEPTTQRVLDTSPLMSSVHPPLKQRAENKSTPKGAPDRAQPILQPLSRGFRSQPTALAAGLHSASRDIISRARSLDLPTLSTLRSAPQTPRVQRFALPDAQLESVDDRAPQRHSVSQPASLPRWFHPASAISQPVLLQRKESAGASVSEPLLSRGFATAARPSTNFSLPLQNDVMRSGPTVESEPVSLNVQNRQDLPKPSYNFPARKQTAFATTPANATIPANATTTLQRATLSTTAVPTFVKKLEQRLAMPIQREAVEADPVEQTSRVPFVQPAMAMPSTSQTSVLQAKRIEGVPSQSTPIGLASQKTDVSAPRLLVQSALNPPISSAVQTTAMPVVQAKREAPSMELPSLRPPVTTAIQRQIETQTSSSVVQRAENDEPQSHKEDKEENVQQVQLLAQEVWMQLKRRLIIEKERMGLV